ncbi:tumor necrosis factor receptor superfamily member 9a [Hemibagrus wyckioides]|nr:tumor necrosis factor receptor superfamily member 9a [Hemibagrus wyckioides]
MRLIQPGLCHILLITTVLYTTEAVTSGCQTWNIKGDKVCCEKCNPGNRLVAQCGLDRSVLCTPCKPNTFTVLPLTPYCHRCTQCIDPQVQEKPCNASADTVCGCKSGFRCGDQECTYCIEECTKGQEPTDERDCRKCPDGTFNDKIHSACKPWTKRCPEGEQIIVHGNEFSDIQCGKGPDATSSDNFFYPLIGIFAAISALIIILFLLLWFAYKRTKNKSQSKDLKPTTPSQGELTIMMVEHEEACSFHQPEQEQGGSSESINTQDSESKLIV